MRNTGLTLILLGGFSFLASAQGIEADSTAVRADKDTVGTVLDELVVTGVTQRVIKHGVEYTPDKKVKKMAQDAASLLRRMSLPELNVSPDGSKITTLADKSVSMFIDYIKAGDQDLKGMRTEDVLRVEVLQYPDDPRFESAAYVVNFIMKKYEWGGYTKLNVTGNAITYNTLDGRLYSKFAYKKWTFDASVGGSIAYKYRNPGYQEEYYRDFYKEGERVDELTRIAETGKDYSFRRNSQWASFRALYVTPKMNMSHTVSFLRGAIPEQRSTSKVSYSQPILPSADAVSRIDNQSLSPRISGDYFFSLPEKDYLSLSWDFSYSALKRNSAYQLGELSPIVNRNRKKPMSLTDI